MRDLAKENEGKYNTKCKDFYDRKARERKCEIGDMVLVRNPDNEIHGFSRCSLDHMLLLMLYLEIHTKYTGLTTEQINATNYT